MPATNFTPIQLYRSTTASQVPTSGNLSDGELAINTNDEKLYFKNSGGTVKLLASSAGASGDVVGPASATDNAVVRFDGTTGKLVQNSVVTIADSTGDVAGVGALTMGGNLTLSGGTANGVLYLNGSKVATSGSALTFDASRFTVQPSIPAATPTWSAVDTAVFSQTSNSIVQLHVGASGGTLGFGFSTASTRNAGLISFDTGSPSFAFSLSGSEQMRLTSTGLGIGTSSPGAKLHTQTAIAGTQGIVECTSGSSYLQVKSNNSAAVDAALMFTDGSNISYFGALRGTSGGVAGALQAYTGGAIRMTLDSSGNLGLGVTPSAWISSGRAIDILAFGSVAQTSSGSLASTFNAYQNSAGNWIYKTTNAAAQYQCGLAGLGQHAWFTAASGTAGNAITFTQAMTLDASSNLGVGTTSPATRLHATQTSNNATVRPLMVDNGGNSGTCVAGISFANAGTVKSSINAAVLDNDFMTFCVGGSGNTERARITSGGDLLVGTTVTNSGISLIPSFSSSGSSGIDIKHPSGAPSGDYFQTFQYNAGVIGSITQNGVSQVLYNISSDQRLKENIQDADSASGLIDALKVRQFDWKADGSHQRYGFVAQEMVAVAPEAVHQPTDPESMMAVDYSKLVPMLIKEVQSLRARVALLEGN